MAAQPRAAQDLDQLFDLTKTVLDPNRPFGKRLESALAAESDYLGLSCGFLTGIDAAAERQAIAIASDGAGSLQEGESVPLSESYCRRTIASESGTFAVADALADGWADDPAYQRFGLESYVGSTVEVGGECHGTLCFGGVEPREEPFDGTAVAFVELLAQWASFELAHRTGREPVDPADDRFSSVLDGTDPSAVDAALGLLANRTRRELLAYLATTNGPITVEEAAAYLGNAGGVRGESTEQMEIGLVHAHIPKLTDANVVDYDERTRELRYRPTDTVERVRRLVRPLE